jgi:thiamine-phosphate pyrophosphorylase
VLPRLVLVTDRLAAAPRMLGDVVAAALAGVPAGAALVQLREKDLGGGELLALARHLRQVAAARGCALLVNDRLDVALAVGAAGVHLPEQGLPVAAARQLTGPDFVVGASVHDPAAAIAAAAAGASFVVLGPIHTTPSKASFGAPLGAAALAAAATRAAASCPVFAIGGIDSPARARAARVAGAHGVAVIRAVMSAADPTTAAAALYEAVS